MSSEAKTRILVLDDETIESVVAKGKLVRIRDDTNVRAKTQIQIEITGDSDKSNNQK